jgi:hypothetical protein
VRSLIADILPSGVKRRGGALGLTLAERPTCFDASCAGSSFVGPAYPNHRFGEHSRESSNILG